MKSFTRALAGLGMAACLLAPATSMAIGHGTPDESPPAEEAVCDDAGLIGAALGLCIAFCEANDCDTHPKAKACRKLRSNYARISGELTFPCEMVEPPPSLR